jgi:hypothetical protein
VRDELRHGAGLVGLADVEAERDCLLERHLLRDGLQAREEWCDHDTVVLDRLAELDGLFEHRDSLHRKGVGAVS